MSISVAGLGPVCGPSVEAPPLTWWMYSALTENDLDEAGLTLESPDL